MKRKHIRYLTRKQVKKVAKLLALTMLLPQLPVTGYAAEDIEVVESETEQLQEAESETIIIEEVGKVITDPVDLTEDSDVYDVVYDDDVGKDTEPDVLYEDEYGNISETEYEASVIYEEADAVAETEVIYVDDPEMIPIGTGSTVIVETADEEESIFTKGTAASSYEASDYEVDLLAKLIHHEAGNQPRAGKVAVGEVVMNRVNSDLFTQNNITDIIYAPGQFSYNEELANMHPTTEEYEIAEGIIDGTERIFNDESVLFFKNPTITSSGNYNSDDIVDWGKYEWYCFIGGHAFYSVPT